MVDSIKKLTENLQMQDSVKDFKLGFRVGLGKSRQIQASNRDKAKGVNSARCIRYLRLLAWIF